jgi:magnesium-protoporphyrin O-methyltransferase
VSFLTERGIAGASVLEISGEVGEIQVELLRGGATRATNREISTTSEAEAVELFERSALRDRVDRRFLDIAQAPDEVEPADVVVPHRVVCCYPDYERLLAGAGAKAERLLVFSYLRATSPPGPCCGGTAVRRLKVDSFRTFAHSPAEMLAVLFEAWLRGTYRWRGSGWCVVGLER